MTPEELKIPANARGVNFSVQEFDGKIVLRVGEAGILLTTYSARKLISQLQSLAGRIERDQKK